MSRETESDDSKFSAMTCMRDDDFCAIRSLEWSFRMFMGCFIGVAIAQTLVLFLLAIVLWIKMPQVTVSSHENEMVYDQKFETET